MKIEFTKEELITLNKLMDIALKAAGINVAQVALHFVTKFNQALNGEAENVEDLKVSEPLGKPEKPIIKEK